MYWSIDDSIDIAVPLAKNVLGPSSTMAWPSAADGAIQRKMCRQGVVRAGEKMTLAISNEDMNNNIRIIKPLERLGVLVDGVSKTVKYKIKK